jgi:hypothetical protein
MLWKMEIDFDHAIQLHAPSLLTVSQTALPLVFFLKSVPTNELRRSCGFHINMNEIIQPSFMLMCDSDFLLKSPASIVERASRSALNRDLGEITHSCRHNRSLALNPAVLGQTQ